MSERPYTLTEGYEAGNADPHWFKFTLNSDPMSRTATVERYHQALREMDTAESWCEEQFGECCAGGGWYRDQHFFHFGYETWAAAFKLRWG